MSVMKKIFFLLNSMNVGGVEKAFLGLLSTIPRDKYEVHLGLLRCQGGFIKYIPTDVTVHHIDCYDKYWRIINDPPLDIIKQLLKYGKIIDAVMHFLLYINFKLTGDRYWFYRYLLRKVPCCPEKYDFAIAYAGPSQAIDYYVCKKICAKKKYGWIHFDVSCFGIDKGMTRRLYKYYNKVYVVSETAKQKFDEIFPEFMDKTEVRYNVVDEGQIKRMSEESGAPYNDNCGKKKILTVGRVSKEKGQMMTLPALKALVDNGLDVVWYYIGHGNDLENCKRQAKDMGLEDRAVFLGALINPYPYMRHCDLYVQPSVHEGFCITLAEAKIFNKPIVATDFTGAREQLESYNSPWRICNHCPQEIADAIRQLL